MLGDWNFTIYQAEAKNAIIYSKEKLPVVRMLGLHMKKPDYEIKLGMNCFACQC